MCRTVSTDALQVLLGSKTLYLEVRCWVILYELKRNLHLAEDEDWLRPSDLVDNDIRRYEALLRE